MSPSGILVQVGRNHRQNDWISLRQARSGDLWFHAQECPGSHVVLKSSNAPADEDDLQLATDLAAYFSRARGNSIASVVMVPTNQLQRIAGAGPGTVRHGSGEIRWGHPQRIKERLFPPSLVEKTG
jgi:predicted ribosome quality control (RQC) complex YloA/Tae2 family protein